MRLSGGKNKFDMSRRLFQSFQKGIKAVGSNLVDFINYINLKTIFCRSKFNILPQLPDLLNAPVRCAVNLDDIEAAPLGDFQTEATAITRLRGRPLLAIQGLG